MDATAAVPHELLLLVFDFLSQPTLLCAARVSRRWRLAARSCSEFYRFIPLVGESGRQADAASLVAAWVRVADECLALGTPVGVQVKTIGFPGIDISPERGPAFESIFQKIRDLLGQTVHLRLMLHGVNAAVVLRALTSPAPVLRSLVINLDDGDLSPLDDSDIPSPILVDFAPRLDKLRLVNVPLDYTRPHPAFRGVRNITIIPSSYHLLASLHKTFPSAVTLDIGDMDYDAPGLPPASLPLYRLRSITARALTCIPPPIRDLMRCLPAISVHAEFIGRLLSWEGDIAPLFAALPDPLELSIMPSSANSWALSGCPASDPRTTRTLEVPGFRSRTFISLNPICRVPWLWPDLRPLLSRLRSLEIDVTALDQLPADLGATLGALAALTIAFAPHSRFEEAARCWSDFHDWVDKHCARGPLRCPRLARLALSWPRAYYYARAPPRLVSQAVLLRLASALHAPGPLALSLSGIHPQRVAAEPERRATDDAAFQSVFKYDGDDWVDGDLHEGHDE